MVVWYCGAVVLWCCGAVAVVVRIPDHLKSVITSMTSSSLSCDTICIDTVSISVLTAHWSLWRDISNL